MSRFIGVILALSFIVCACNKPKVRNSIVVGTNAEYPPYSYVDHGSVVGFDIDLTKEICQRLHKEIVLYDMPFDALIPALILNKIDLIAGGLTKTDERSKNALFTTPYILDNPLVIVSRKTENFENIEDLTGKQVVVNEGYLADLYASDLQGIELVRLSAPADAFIALSQDKVDAFITAKSTTVNFLKEYPNSEYYISSSIGISDEASLAFSKKNGKLLDEVERVLSEMREDGSLSQLKSKWGL